MTFRYEEMAENVLKALSGEPELRVREALDSAVRDLTGGRPLLRYVCLDAGGLARLGEEGLGLHWTSDASDMSLDALRIPLEADDTWRMYEIAALPKDPSDVDWPATVAARLSIPWEREIVLKKEAVVSVVSIAEIDELDAEHRRHIRHVRADLTSASIPAGAEAAAPTP